MEADGPATWVPFAESLQWMVVERGCVRHTRPACGIDTARGIQHIKDGRWRIEYRIKAHDGHSIVLGVTDVEAAAWSQKAVAVDDGDGKDAKKKPDKKDKKGGGKDADAGVQKFKPGKPSVAWGLCSASGRLVSTYHPRVGRFGGATVSEPLVQRRAGSAEGMTIVVECDIPPHNSPVDALNSRRDFTHGLHPLDAPRDFPLHLQALSMRTAGGSPITKAASLSFSVNGGQVHTTPVHLPEAGVYPWVQLTGEGEVAIVSIVNRSTK